MTDYRKQPWKHPAIWPGHMVRRTREHLCGVPTSVATCECAWALCTKVSAGGAGHVALDDAINDHWLEVIAAAERAPA